MTSKERALNKINSNIESLERKIPEIKESLEGIVDQETASKVVRTEIEQLKMWVYLKESVFKNTEENPQLFKFKLNPKNK